MFEVRKQTWSARAEQVYSGNPLAGSVVFYYLVGCGEQVHIPCVGAPSVSEIAEASVVLISQVRKRLEKKIREAETELREFEHALEMLNIG